MNRDTFCKHVDELIHQCNEVLGTKGEDYSYAEEDRLSNFKQASRDTDTSVFKVWYIYFNKGLSAIRHYVTHSKVESEDIHARIVDAINYLILLDALITETEQGQPENYAGNNSPTSTNNLADTVNNNQDSANTEIAKHIVPKYVHGDKVYYKGISCRVLAIHKLHKGFGYDLGSEGSNSIFSLVEEEEIRINRFPSNQPGH